MAKIMELSKEKNVKIYLPGDFVTANKFDKDAKVCTVALILNVACSR